MFNGVKFVQKGMKFLLDVTRSTVNGWNENEQSLKEGIKPYFPYQSELSIYQKPIALPGLYSDSRITQDGNNKGNI